MNPTCENPPRSSVLVNFAAASSTSTHVFGGVSGSRPARWKRSLFHIKAYVPLSKGNAQLFPFHTTSVQATGYPSEGLTVFEARTRSSLERIAPFTAQVATRLRPISAQSGGVPPLIA